MRAWLVLLLIATPAVADEDRVEPKPLHSFPGIDIVETVNQARRGRDEIAKINDARLNVRVTDMRAHRIEIRSVAVVIDRCGKPKPRLKPRKLLGHELFPPMTKGGNVVVLPAGGAGSYGVVMAIEALPAKRACGFAFDLVVDRVRKKIEMPLQLTPWFD